MQVFVLPVFQPSHFFYKIQLVKFNQSWSQANVPLVPFSFIWITQYLTDKSLTCLSGILIQEFTWSPLKWWPKYKDQKGFLIWYNGPLEQIGSALFLHTFIYFFDFLWFFSSPKVLINIFVPAWLPVLFLKQHNWCSRQDFDLVKRWRRRAGPICSRGPLDQMRDPFWSLYFGHHLIGIQAMFCYLISLF